MNETEKNTQVQRSKISKWATSSMYSPLIGIALILLSFVFLDITFNIIACNIFSWIIKVGCILIVFGFVAGIIGLICIKASKGKLKGTGFAISGIIISLIPIIFQLYCLYMFFYYEEPYDDSNPKAIIAKVEKFYDFNFPEKIDNLKAAEKTFPGIDHTFIARFTTDQNSFAKLRNSLSKKEYYSGEITDELLTENGKRYTYDLWISDKWKSMWRWNAPEWFNEEIPKGKVYEFYTRCKTMRRYFIYVELPDSNEVVVVEGWRKLKDNLMKPEEVNDLKWADEQEQ